MKKFKGLMKVSLLIIFVSGFLAVSNQSVGAQEETMKKTVKVGLVVLKDNPDYQTGRAGFTKILEADEELDVQFLALDAQGDMDVYTEGLSKLVNEDNVDLIFTTGTRSTIPAVNQVKTVPIVFTAVADPVLAKIVSTLDHPGGNATGTHCGVSAFSQIKTIKKVLPDAQTIGIVYTKDEPNAEIQTEKFKEVAAQLGLKIITSTVSKDTKTEEEVSSATRQLVGRVDVLVGHQDTTIARYGKGLIAVAEEKKIPTYMSLGNLLSQGAMFSLGVDFGVLGEKAGVQAVKILKEGVEPKDIPVETDKNYSLSINLNAAKKIGVTVPVQVLKSASKVMK